MTPSNDFASAAMLRLIQLGLRQQGLAQDSTAANDPSRPKTSNTAHVPLPDKRALANRLHQAHGSTALLRMGEALHSAPDEPALVALSMARDPLDLMVRWQRLECFVHSRHRVKVDIVSSSRIAVEHHSLDALQAPSPGEDLLIFGLLVALMHRIGATHLRARFSGERSWRWQRGVWRNLAAPANTSHWQMEWQGQNQNQRAREFVRPPSATAASSHDAEHTAVTATANATALLGADPGRAWSVAALAEELGASPRHMQRLFQLQHVSFTALLSQARSTQAAKCLVTTTQSASEIGYACGYADQAHFNRDFKRHTAFTPLKYRQQFAV